MQAHWDRDKGGRDQWIAWLAGIMAEARRCLRPGGYALVWALPRTSHWTATALEDSGFRIIDIITHHFGQGFPKGKGQLKPASEHWILCRAPGPLQPLQIDACRVPTAQRGEDPRGQGRPKGRDGCFPFSDDAWGNGHLTRTEGHAGGRWPSNLVLSHVPPAPDGSGGCQPAGVRRVRAHWSQPTRGTLDGSMFNPGDQQHGQPVGYADAEGYETVDAWTCHPQCPIRLLDEQAGPRTSGGSMHERSHAHNGIYGAPGGQRQTRRGSDDGPCSRFFPTFAPDPEDTVPFRYQSKASPSERRLPDGTRHNHPTTKPLALMSHLVRLVTGPGGVVLDCFGGSMSTGVACLREGFSFIGIEMSAEYVAIGRTRLEHAERTTGRQLAL